MVMTMTTFSKKKIIQLYLFMLNLPDCAWAHIQQFSNFDFKTRNVPVIELSLRHMEWTYKDILPTGNPLKKEEIKRQSQIPGLSRVVASHNDHPWKQRKSTLQVNG